MGRSCSITGKQKLCKIMDMIISLNIEITENIEIISPSLHRSKHQSVHLDYIQLLFVKSTSVTLGEKASLSLWTRCIPLLVYVKIVHEFLCEVEPPPLQSMFNVLKPRSKYLVHDSWSYLFYVCVCVIF